jgi:DMSO/TMAO reductase YedYZ molybdopterin-dependent catalytic subunit
VRLPVRAAAALAGVVAAAVALGVAELAAVVTGAGSSPLVAVGGVVIDLVPERVKEFGVRLFYTYDKLALLAGTLLLLCGLAALIGLLALRRRAAGVAGIALVGLLGAVAAVTRHGAAWTAVLPSLLGGAAGCTVLLALRARLVTALHPDGPVRDAQRAGAVLETPGGGVETSADGDSAPRTRQPVLSADDRRGFLRTAGGALAAAVAAGLAGRWLADRRGVSAARSAVRLPQPGSPAPALPADPAAAVPELSVFTTPSGEFYRIDTALAVPQVDPREWRLKIHGRVRAPVTLDYGQLLARPMIERYITLACVSNEIGGDLIGNARWLGVPLKELLAEVGPDDGADQVVSRSVDGFTAGTPTAVLLDGRDAMLAVAMNGAPLPVEHGFPVRMVVPGLYGYVSATKWLAELELSSFADFDGYWIKRGWAQQAPIKTGCRIDTPRQGGGRAAGRLVVAGVAWAQHRGVSTVEVRVDDGDWRPATLAAVPSVDTWRQWTYSWEATPGRHRLWARATDNAGGVQTEAAAAPFPDGATGWHHVDVQIG